MKRSKYECNKPKPEELGKYRDFNKHTGDCSGGYTVLEVGDGPRSDCAFCYWWCRYYTNSTVGISYRLVAGS